METVREVFRNKPTKGSIGIEIEVEGNNLPEIGGAWRCEHDGSLRGEAMEYVLRRPVELPEAYKSLATLSHAFKENGSQIADTGRAGVHIHVNCQELNIIQLYNFITLYLIFEDSLVKWCGPDRVGNLFCLRAKDAEWLLFNLASALEDGEFRRRFSSDELRYASMNVKALAQYGSLEFRAMRSTADMELIYQWAGVLHDLRERAKATENPVELIYQVSAGGEEAFLDNYLGEFAEVVKEVDEDWMQSIRDGMRRAQEIAFAGDWEALAQGPKRVIGGIEVDQNFEDDFPPMDV
tara:strand:+ start:6840 stop:7721 length:882 start_codon:yes stop_codon:yes gene_type:complete